MGKLGSCWPHTGRDQCLLNNTELVRKNFFLLKVPLECFQTRRVLQRTRNRMRAAKSAFRQMREACLKHLYALKGETDTFSCQGGAPRSLNSSPPQVPWFPSCTFPLSSSIGTVPWNQPQAKEDSWPRLLGEAFLTEGEQMWPSSYHLFETLATDRKHKLQILLPFLFSFIIQVFSEHYNRHEGENNGIFKTQSVQSIIYETRTLSLRKKKQTFKINLILRLKIKTKST